MKSTDDKSLIPVAIATDAATDYIRTIPTTQATAGDGSVSIDLGFPPECAISSTAGGKRPEMKDVNGVYNLLSSAIRSIQGQYGLYDADFATAISGYPLDAVVFDSSGVFWVSTAESNLTVPGDSGASWVIYGLGSLTVNGDAWVFKSPGGLIIQGGRVNTNSGGNLAFTFPETFPTKVLFQSVQESNAASNWANGTFAVLTGSSRVSTSAMQIFTTVIQVESSGNNPTLSYFGGKSVTCDWIAIGE